MSSETKTSVSGRKERHILLDVLFRLVQQKRLGTLGGFIVVVFIFTGLFANFLAPMMYDEIVPGAFRKPPSTQFLLGTDQLGRDLFSRIIYGARFSMIVAVGGTSLSIVVAVLIGVVSGFFGGKIDIIVQRLVDAAMSFPWLVFVLSIIAIIGPGIIQVIIVLGLINGIRNSRIVRGAVIGLKENTFIDAAKAIGCSRTKILIRHVFPNITAPVIIIFSASLGYMILAEATMSFLGYGIPPPVPSWGGMLTIGGRRYMLLAPWIAIWPGVALSVVVFGVNVFGDALRDLLDPRLRGGLGRFGGFQARVEKAPPESKS
jgi:peptide/nickel transport system permease protein